MKRAASAGNDRELRVMDWLTQWGWMCGSRRHIGGAGDIIAVRWFADDDRADASDPLGDADLIIVEVKSTQRPYDHFLPADRQAMRDLAADIHADAWLAWWPARKPLVWLPAAGWPRTLVKAPDGQLELKP